MELTDGQKKGLEIACQRYKDNKPYTVIAGFGGTGKSFLVCHIIKELKLKDNEVVFIAFTGKAALVLKEKGNKNTMTAHKLLYHSEEQADGTYIHTPKTKLDHKYKLIVVDEASMLPQEMIDLLLSHHVYTIFLGDPAQPPPISGEQTILSNPHVFLDEIVRQALDNPMETESERKELISSLQDKFGLSTVQKKDNRYFRFHSEDSLKITKIILNNIPHNLDIVQDKILSKNKYRALGGEKNEFR